MTIRTILLHLLLLTAGAASAQADTIHLKDNRLLCSSLKPGLRQYIVYFQQKDNPTFLKSSIWLRDISIMDKGNEKLFAISQHWYGNDSTSYRTIYSLNRMKDFAPVYHIESMAGKIIAFNWSENNIAGADTIANNAAGKFHLDFNAPCFNWNLDIETFEMLPLAAGKSFVIPFYEGGMQAPQYVLYKVTGDEILPTLDNRKVDCWKLVTAGEHNGNRYSQSFWISKKDHEFLKELDSFTGGYRYKLKLPAFAPKIL